MCFEIFCYVHVLVTRLQLSILWVKAHFFFQTDEKNAHIQILFVMLLSSNLLDSFQLFKINNISHSSTIF
jgi:hypothetical protein